MSWVYRSGVRLRHWFYDQKVLSKAFSPLPTVSIGNLVAGGSGKSQVALLLANTLSDLPLAILSRGYKGGAEHAPDPLIVDTQKHCPARTGDEPWLLSSRLHSSSSFVVVNKSRYKSALAAEKWGARLLILDDGMQHRALHRDFEIVVIDGKTPLKAFLPWGKLREEPYRLKEADALVYIGEPKAEVAAEITQHTDAPAITMEIISEGNFDLEGVECSLKERKVALFCGIGNPLRFVKTVEQLGGEVVATLFAPDHELPSKVDLDRFAIEAKEKGAEYLVCTEKDKVKLSKNQWPLKIVWVKAALRVVANQEGWQKIIEEIKLMVRVIP